MRWGLLGAIGLLVGAGGASAGTRTTTNACRVISTSTFQDVAITMAGTAVPNPVPIGELITLGGSSLQALIPANLVVAAYNVGLLPQGAVTIPVSWWAARAATNTTQSVLAVSGTSNTVTTISDPDHVAGNGDESATDLNLTVSLPNSVWTAIGGPIEFRQAPPGSLPPIGSVTPSGSVFFRLSIAGGVVTGSYDCQPGMATAGGSSFTPSTASPFETASVTAPPTAPVCSGESLTVVAGQTIAIDLSDNCTDINGDLDVSTFAPTSPTAGTLTQTGPGTYDFEAPAPAPASPVTFDFLVADTTGLLSNDATVSITVTTPPQPSKCTSDKYKAAGNRALGKLKCLAKAIKTAVPVDAACLQKAEGKFASKWAVAEQRGDCLTFGDQALMGAKVDDFVTETRAALEPTVP